MLKDFPLECALRFVIFLKKYEDSESQKLIEGEGHESHR